ELLAARTYGSKTRRVKCAGMPGPVSSISKRTRLRRVLMRSVTSRVLASPRYLMALRKRLPRRLSNTPGLHSTAQAGTSSTRSLAPHFSAGRELFDEAGDDGLDLRPRARLRTRARARELEQPVDD